MDIVGRFIQEECIRGKQYSVKFSDLYEKYTQWCEDSGEYELTTTALGRELSNRGYRKFKRGYRLGLRLRQKGEGFQECDRFDRFDRLPKPPNAHARAHAHAHVEFFSETDQTDQTDHTSQNGYQNIAIATLENGQYAVVEDVDGELYHYYEDERTFTTENEARQSLNGHMRQ
jgi:phage/plasmid-associated DNA primase